MRLLPNLAAVLVLTLACSASGLAADQPVPAAADSTAEWRSALENARAAYQAAWNSRNSGQFDVAAAICSRELARLDDVLKQDLDMSSRRELVDLQSRIGGLRDAARKDLESARSAAASGNEADEKTLSAPAAEELQPQWNEQVEHWVEFFTGAGRSTFERWLKRSGRYMDLFRSVLQREGLPPDLVHVVFVESGFNVNARSISAAVGPWQFVRSTGKLFGLTVNQWTDERKDPEKSTVAAARYLKHLYSIFGDWPLALASYNAGEGTVLRAIKSQGTMNYWDLRLPRQTEEYVPQFMAVLTIARDPAKYGFDSVERDGPLEFDEVAFKGAVDLRAIAKLADCSVEALRDLNPAVLKHAASGRDGITTLRVPHGKSEVIAKALEGGAHLAAVDLTIKHRVRRRETLNGIANRYHVSAKRLALVNGIGKTRPLRSGMMLTIPAAAEPRAEIFDGDDPRASTDYVPDRNLRPRVSLNAKSEAGGRILHVVRKGETLDAIARRYDVSPAEIRRWNRLTSSHLRRGTRLKIRVGEAEAATKAKAEAEAKPDAKAASDGAAKDGATKDGATSDATDELRSKDSSRASASATQASDGGRKAKRAAGARARVVTVRAGDTLTRIATRHGVTVRALQRANGLSTTRVRAGQKLKLPAS